MLILIGFLFTASVLWWVWAFSWAARRYLPPTWRPHPRCRVEPIAVMDRRDGVRLVYCDHPWTCDTVGRARACR